MYCTGDPTGGVLRSCTRDFTTSATYIRITLKVAGFKAVYQVGNMLASRKPGLRSDPNPAEFSAKTYTSSGAAS